jgi:hypothetical protein
MADVFKSETNARLGWQWTSEGVKDFNSLDHATNATTGYAWNQAEASWSLSSVELADGASVTYDLTNLTRTVFGDSAVVTLTDLRYLMIKNLTTTEGTLIVGNAGANEWSAMFGSDGETIRVEPSSPFLIANELDGWDVDGSNKNLKLTASGGTTTFSIAIIGATSAGASGSGSGA